MDPVTDPLLLRKSSSAGNRTRASGSVARNSDHQTTESHVTIKPSVTVWSVVMKWYSGSKRLRASSLLG
jgi:hypothetical protein